MALSDTAIRSAKHGPKPIKLFDANGLFLLLQPSGGKLWRLKYRYAGKELKLSVGRYPDVGLKEARRRRDEARELLANGLDPTEQKRAQKDAEVLSASMTFRIVGEEYLTKAAREGREAVTIAKSRWLMSLMIADLGHRAISDIKASELLTVLKKVEAKGHLETARRMRSLAGRIFRHAIATARAETDPSNQLRGALIAPKVVHHSALFDEDSVGALLRAIDGYDGQPLTSIALRLTPHVFVRPGELRRAEWAEFDLKGGLWTIPASKMKMREPHLVPLSRQSIALLVAAQALSSDQRYVFSSLYPGNRPMSENTINSALRRLGYSDVRDETIGRFAAARFRITFRSLRPLLEDRKFTDLADAGEETFRRQRLTQEELDEEARAFALTLIDRWVADPANVRLLRIALDLWPSAQILREVLRILRPYIDGTLRQILPREIAYYCLAEILRAGATETGFVEDSEAFPKGVNLQDYRNLLAETALKVGLSKGKTVPWYVRQQALLFLAVHARDRIKLPRQRAGEDRYRRMVRFLVGDHASFSDVEFAILAIVSRRSFLSRDDAVTLITGSVSEGRFAEIAARDIEFARDVYRATNISIASSSGIAEDLGVAEWSAAHDRRSLKDIVANDPLNVLRNEIGVLSFALSFIGEVEAGRVPRVVTPTTVQVAFDKRGGYAVSRDLSFQSVATTRTYRSIYTPPDWAPESQKWRFQLGYLLRYILTARVDFTVPVRPVSWREAEPVYRPTRGHWFQRMYGFYNGHEAFGDDWLPISQFTQDFLFALLIWPGCHSSDPNADALEIAATKALVAAELDKAFGMVGKATGILMLPVAAPIPGTRAAGRPLRGCVVQSVTPEVRDFHAYGPELSDPVIRRKHRNHLSTALAAVEKMLDLRDTHKNQNKRLDWLILPELAVHPRDVSSHLIPFARAFKTAILAGLTYEPVVPGGLLVNSAIWIIPRMVPGQGLQTIVRRQGKKFLSPMETPFNTPVAVIEGFRPCQWLIGYEWTSQAGSDPLWLTGSVCYDGTDLDLVSDLRGRSDIFAIPALNQDVGTFDQMAQALHYHMYQLVIVANNGSFGGSNAYLPRGEAFERQIFHTHGQPQASISFFEINDIGEMKGRRELGLTGGGPWKYPPAGY